MPVSVQMDNMKRQLFRTPPVIGIKQRDILARHFNAERTRAFIRITIGTDADMARLLDATKEFLA